MKQHNALTRGCPAANPDFSRAGPFCVSDGALARAAFSFVLRPLSQLKPALGHFHHPESVLAHRYAFGHVYAGLGFATILRCHFLGRLHARPFLAARPPAVHIRRRWRDTVQGSMDSSRLTLWEYPPRFGVPVGTRLAPSRLAFELGARYSAQPKSGGTASVVSGRLGASRRVLWPPQPGFRCPIVGP